MKKKTRHLLTSKKKKAAKAEKKHKNRLEEFLYDNSFEDDEEGEYTEEEVYYEDEQDYIEDETYATEYEDGYEEEETYYAEDEAEYEDTDEEDIYYAEEDEYVEDDTYFEDEEEQYLYEEYDNEEEYYAEEEDEDAFDVNYQQDNSESKASRPPKKHRKQGFDIAAFAELLREKIAEMQPFDYVLAAMTVIVVAFAIIAGSNLKDYKSVEEQMEAIVPVGTTLSEIGIAGESGLLAMAEAMSNSVNLSEEIEEIETETEEEDENVTVSVSFESVEKDLKIRFRNAATGSYITGTAFEVTLTSSNGKTIVLTDDDKDGVIYQSSMNPGTYSAIITSTDKYQFPTKAQTVTVKNKVEYVVVNVEDEVKKETQVNVSVEDTAKAEAKEEEVTLTDTVEWVESTKTVIGSETYEKTDKSNIADPSLSTSARSSSLKFDSLNVTLDQTSLTMQIGGNATLKGNEFTNYSDDTTKRTYEVKWSSSDESIVTVDNGKVTAKKAGTAKITYTVKETVVTKTEVKGEDTTEIKEVTKEISESEWEALAAEKQSEWTKKEVDGKVSYTKTVTEEVIVKGETTTKEETTTNEGSATCTVTVEAVTISSGALTLAKTADSCSVGSTLTVKAEKLVYTKTDGTTEPITSGFPSITWTSSDTGVATINSEGVVTGVKVGTATITGKVSGVKDKNGKELDIKATTSVTVTAAATLTISLDSTERQVKVKDTTPLTATVTNYKSDSSVTWSSSNTSLATVDSKGVVTMLAVGKVTITATTVEKDVTSGKQVSASCTITIVNDAMSDTKTKLKDKNGNQIYIKDANGNYVEAVYADYYTASEFYLKTSAQYAYTGWQTIDGKTYYYDKNGKPVTGTQIIKGVTYNFGADGAIATSVNGSTFGIDVSKWNGKIDWAAVKASGVDYVIIRCGYRGSSSGALIEDSLFKTNIQGATAAGLKVGIYFFSQAVTEAEAVKEASFAVEKAKGYKLTYPIFIDTEPSGGRADGLDKATRTAVVNAFCKTVTDAGYKAGIYASKSWFETKLNTSSLTQYKIWLAQYASKPTYAGRYDMWQYSHRGTISGINGSVDLNYSYLGY